jgi:hypothetical protein
MAEPTVMAVEQTPAVAQTPAPVAEQVSVPLNVEQVPNPLGVELPPVAEQVPALPDAHAVSPVAPVGVVVANSDPNLEAKPVEQQAPDVQMKPSIKMLRKSRAFANRKRTRPAQPKALTKTIINDMLGCRAETVGPVFGHLFEFDDCVPVNDLGDMRFGGCSILSQLGPFSPGEEVEIIDWLPSTSTILISKSAKVSETVALEMAPATVISHVPIQFF